MLVEQLQLCIHGLTPPCFLSQDVQLLRVMRSYERQQSDLDRSVVSSGQLISNTLLQAPQTQPGPQSSAGPPKVLSV